MDLYKKNQNKIDFIAVVDLQIVVGIRERWPHAWLIFSS
jgi:hypothetical protein